MTKHSNNFQFYKCFAFKKTCWLGIIPQAVSALATLRLSIFNFQLIIVLASTMMFSSCVNDIPYDAEIGAPKLVLNAMLSTDSLLTATVGRTVHFLDTEAPQRLSDATVTAVIDGQSIALTYDEATQTYRSDYTLHAGDEVTLTATHALGTATATEQVVPTTPIAIVKTTMLPFTPPGDPVTAALLNKVDSALLVSIYMDDPAEETNYYRLSIDYEGSYEVMYSEGALTLPSPEERELADIAGCKALLHQVEQVKTVETFFPHYLFTESSTRLITTSESMSQMFGGLLYMTSSNTFIFSDENLRGQDGQPVVEFLFLMESPSTFDFNPESGWVGDDVWGNEDYIFPADTVSSATYHYGFMLEHLSADYYRYMEDVAMFEFTGGAFISEPLPIHTNIRGGLGIVGSYSSTPWVRATRGCWLKQSETAVNRTEGAG